MGIESEHLVFDYLSRVGDLAHRTVLSAAERARLVAEVRSDIDRRRAAAGGAQSTAAVKKILGRVGRPEEVVARAVAGRARAGGGPGGEYGSAYGGGGAGDGGGRGGNGRGGDGGSGGRGSPGARRDGELSRPGGPAPGTPEEPETESGTRDGHPPSGTAPQAPAARAGTSGASAAVGTGSGAPAAHRTEPFPLTTSALSTILAARNGTLPQPSAPAKEDGSGPERAVPRPSGGGTGTGTGTDNDGGTDAGGNGTNSRDTGNEYTDTDAGTGTGTDTGTETGGPGPADRREPDWWRVEPGPYRRTRPEDGGPPHGRTPRGGGPADHRVPLDDSGGQIGGFVGGIEAPEMLGLPPETDRDGLQGHAGTAEPGTEHPVAADPGAGSGAEAGTEADPGTAPSARRRLLPLPRRRPKTERGGPRAGGVVEWLATLALLAGTVLDEPIALGAGWLLAYWSPRLGRTEAKRAVLVVPGAVAVGAVVWLWGRSAGRWGEPVPAGETGEALTAMLPALLQAAAVASALYLLWRARRRL